MDVVQIFCFVGIVLISVLKAVTLKPCANHLPSQYTPLFLSFWMTISLLFCTPFFFDEIYNDFVGLKPELLYGVLKGIFFFEYVNTGQKLSKETASSRVFMVAVAVGIIAIINVFLFQEVLTFNQLMSSLLISLLGIIYYFKGHLSETSFKSHKAFLTMLILAVILSVVDHLGLSSMHWFTYLIINIPIMLIISLFANRNNESLSFKFFFSNKYLFLAAFVYVLAEFYLTRVRVSILPVTIANIAALMSIPLIMIIMNKFWGESTLKKQVFFGFSAFILGLIAFL